MKAKPSVLDEAGKSDKYAFSRQSRYTDAYVEDVQRGVKSCKVHHNSLASAILDR
jgi:POT family proton-dependent oligopeptide transporter